VAGRATPGLWTGSQPIRTRLVRFERSRPINFPIAEARIASATAQVIRHMAIAVFRSAAQITLPNQFEHKCSEYANNKNEFQVTIFQHLFSRPENGRLDTLPTRPRQCACPIRWPGR